MFKDLVAEIVHFEEKITSFSTTTSTIHTASIGQLLLVEQPYFILLQRNENQIEYVSASCLEFLHNAQEALSIDHLLSIIHPEDLANYQQSKLHFEAFLETLELSERPFYKYRFNYRICIDATIIDVLHQELNFYIQHADHTHSVISLLIFSDVSAYKTDHSQDLSYIGLEGRTSVYNVQFESSDSTAKCILSVREKEIAQLIYLGKNRSQIAEQLHISIHTVDTHKRKILRKLGCNSIKELISKHALFR